MPELDLSYHQTPERAEIIETLDRAVALLTARAEAHDQTNNGQRRHRALNRAQQIAGVRELLTLDWHEDDAVDSKTPPKS